jgi:cation diffusion facilitator family transporter
VVLVSTLLAIVKTVSGIVGHSYALVADGIESMLDIVGSLIVWGGLRIAAVPPDHDHPYGHGKAESLAAMAVSLFLIAAAVGIAIQAVGEIFVPHHAPAPFTLVVLVVVVATKEILYRRMTGLGRRLDSTAMRADAWHHRSDALTSAAAFVGISVALLAGEGYESADDWAALVACVVIGANGARILRVAVADVMDSAGPEPLLNSVRRTASAVDGVDGIETCRVRKSGPGWLVDLHAEVDGGLSVSHGHAIAHQIKDALCRSDLGILDVLVHIEPSPNRDGAASRRSPR